MELQEFKNMLRIDGSYDDANLLIHLESAKSYVLNSINVKTTEQEEAVKSDSRFKMIVGLLAAMWYQNKTLTSETQQHALPHSFYPLIQQLDFLKAQVVEPEEPEEPTEPVETVEIKINDVVYQATVKNELSFTLLNGETFDTHFLNVDGTDYGVISSTPEQTVLTAIESFMADGEWGDIVEWTGFVNNFTLYVFGGSVEAGLAFSSVSGDYRIVNEISTNIWNLEEF